MHNVPKLKTSCLKYIAKHGNELMSSDSENWKNFENSARPELLKELVRQLISAKVEPEEVKSSSFPSNIFVSKPVSSFPKEFPTQVNFSFNSQLKAQKSLANNEKLTIVKAGPFESAHKNQNDKLKQ